MKGLVVVAGLLAQYPLGGMAWHYLQYLLACRQLGLRCIYLEDTGQYPYDPATRGLVDTIDGVYPYISGVMEEWGFADQWAYRAPWDGQWFGMDESAVRSAYENADVILNVSGALQLTGDWKRAGTLVFVDTDPVFTQVKLLRGQEPFRRYVHEHDAHFTFGETLPLPFSETAPWKPTRQPIALEAWTTDVQPRDCFTTVMNWTSYRTVEWEGRSYGQKDIEFEKVMTLPSDFAPGTFELAVNAGKTRRTPSDLLRHRGWQTVDPEVLTRYPNDYRLYIQSSKGEVTVVKNAYVDARCGWFSERSACYLAAGRPVISQDSGFSQILPTGLGLLAFDTPAEAGNGVREVLRDYERHRRAARGIAEEFFDGGTVLRRLLSEL